MSLLERTKKLLIEKFSGVGLVVIGGAFLVAGYKIYWKPWRRKRTLTKAEQHANFIYEQRKKISQQ